MKACSHFTLHTNMNARRIKKWSIRSKSLKLTEENKGGCSDNIGMGNAFVIKPQGSQEGKKKRWVVLASRI